MKFASTGSQVASQPALCDCQDADPSSGFSLLETLTALTILAIALVSLFEAQTSGIRAVGATSGYSKARILAHSLLAESLNGTGFPPAPANGRRGMFTWSIDVSQAGESWAAIKSKQNWQLHHVLVTVVWDKDRRIELQSLKIARVVK